MCDYTVKGLEQGFKNLSMQGDHDNNEQHPSIVDDPIFQHFYSKKEVDEKGFTHFEQVAKFQEPIDLTMLLDNKLFINAIKAHEPGRYLSYRQIRKDLEMVEESIEGGPERVREMFNFSNRLSTTHNRFVRASCALTVLEMYEKIILRLYDIVPDQKFKALPELQSLLFKVEFEASKLPYSEVTFNTHETIKCFEQQVKQATKDIEDLKNSIEFKTFRAKLNTATQVHECKVHQAYIEAQRGASEAAKEYIQRLAEVKDKNARMNEQRIRKNLTIKTKNLGNVHQLGNQTRTPLPDSVIQALSIIQDSYKGTIFDETFNNSKKQEKSDEDASEDGVHEATEDIENKNEEPEGFEDEPLQGVYIPNGFEHIGVPVTAAHVN
ncbi:hypothetical protein H2198_005819 [Neophaeococcomyces mojaviensis]|uniref:Uncharacterized protein n=1 Tax=Neophaeococcomyces mojaviensis TaxID=3383035 RepID=A0ACC3A545_9EURO|nr:hypothetical protein H2198_005819 [Knufia sp. JES_112]